MSKQSKSPATLAGASRAPKTAAPSKDHVVANDNSVEDENPAVVMLVRRHGYELWRARLEAYLHGFGRDT